MKEVLSQHVVSHAAALVQAGHRGCLAAALLAVSVAAWPASVASAQCEGAMGQCMGPDAPDPTPCDGEQPEGCIGPFWGIGLAPAQVVIDVPGTIIHYRVTMSVFDMGCDVTDLVLRFWPPDQAHLVDRNNICASPGGCVLTPAGGIRLTSDAVGIAYCYDYELRHQDEGPIPNGNGVIAYACAQGLVCSDDGALPTARQVNLPILVVHPAINIEKDGSIDEVCNGQETPIRYTYTVTNAGDVPLNTVTVVDDQCGPVNGPSGDANGNGLLDLTETWTYTCDRVITGGITNTATATGFSVPGDFEVSDSDDFVVTGIECCTSSMGDFIWSDTDGDGVQDAGEPGIPGVRVWLFDKSGERLVLIGEDITDATGHYGFSDLCESVYELQVDPATVPAGFTETTPNAGGDDALDSDCIDGIVNFSLGLDEVDLTIDCGLVPPPPGGGEGCTPGYWKQRHHFCAWPPPYAPTTLFSDVFENAFPGKTLLQVLSQGGGGLKALGRHTVAALLNAASDDVSYDLSASDVINAFNAVFPNGDYSRLHRELEQFNEQGCPLGNCHGQARNSREQAPHDLNLDGRVNHQDLVVFFGLLATTNLAVDLDGSGRADAGDVLIILENWTG
jgi:hypothetical protein